LGGGGVKHPPKGNGSKLHTCIKKVSTQQLTLNSGVCTACILPVTQWPYRTSNISLHSRFI